MVAASVIPPQERKGFHLFLLKIVNLKIGMLQWIWFYFLLKSTKIYTQFSRVPTQLKPGRYSMIVFFRGYIAEVEG